jgi:DNA-binding CsgD family transcriptional regulator
VHEMRRINEIRDALASTLDIREAVQTATPLLIQLVPADYAAVGITKPGLPREFDWVVAEMPSQFFRVYPELAQHDFVLRSVLAAPDQVLRDSEMLPRREIEENAMYRRARDLGMPLEHVMSTMLHVGTAWSSGISLYRTERRPFSERDRAVLTELRPALKNAVRNCRLYGDIDGQRHALDALFSHHGLATVLLTPSGSEVARSDAATALIEKWFPLAERRQGGLPERLLEYARKSGSAGEAMKLQTAGSCDLVVRLQSLAHAGHAYSAVVLQEIPNTLSAPVRWRERLTPREYEIVDRVVRGWDNRLVAEDAGCAEWTVRTHLKNAFPKLGVESRGQLTALARQELAAEPYRPLESDAEQLPPSDRKSSRRVPR